MIQAMNGKERWRWIRTLRNLRQHHQPSSQMPSIRECPFLRRYSMELHLFSSTPSLTSDPQPVFKIDFNVLSAGTLNAEGLCTCWYNKRLWYMLLLNLQSCHCNRSTRNIRGLDRRKLELTLITFHGLHSSRGHTCRRGQALFDL